MEKPERGCDFSRLTRAIHSQAIYTSINVCACATARILLFTPSLR
jgi:hypothetical protein